MENTQNVITDQDRQRIQQMWRKLNNVSGPGVTNGPDGITINPPQAVVRRAAVAGGSTGLPPPGLPRQVLQLDDNLNPVWDQVQVL